MIKLLGSRGASAVMGIVMLAVGSSAAAQELKGLDVAAAVKALDTDTSAKPFGTGNSLTATATATATNAVSTASSLVTKAVAKTAAVVTASGTVLQAQPARSVTLALPTDIRREAAWLQSAGWQLYALVDRFSAGAPLDEQANCIATAVYHEARGESLEGQLAVARVIMNRATSGKYPSSWCGVMKQPWQFSFVNPRTGHIPYIDQSSAAWRKALGITRLAINDAFPSVSADVLWYHATYVSPSWGRRLSRAQQIGTHIFYRA